MKKPVTFKSELDISEAPYWDRKAKVILKCKTESRLIYKIIKLNN